MKNIAIIGGGACGSAAFIELVIRICSLDLQKELSITLIERREKLGYGMAFGTAQESHLLNTQAELMGIYVKEPDHFSKWLKSKGGIIDSTIAEGSDVSSAYTSRILYGDYVSEQLEKYLQKAVEKNVKVTLINDEAVDVQRRKKEGVTIHLKTSTSVEADFLLIVPGTPKPSNYSELRSVEGYLDFPWPSYRIKNNIGANDEVGILGSSLSAIDAVLTLMDNGHRASITMFSPFGMLPRVQPAENRPFKRKHLTLENIHKLQRTKLRAPRVKDLFKLYQKDAEEAGGIINWKELDRSGKPVYDFLKYDISTAKEGGDSLLNLTYSLRYDASKMWEWLTLSQKKLFKKELGSHWSVYRHAMPLRNAEKILHLLEKGQLKVISKIDGVRYDEHKGLFRILLAGDEDRAVTRLINATGTASHLMGMENILIENLLENGFLKSYPAGGAVVNSRTMQASSGNSKDNIYLVGHIVNGMLLDVDSVWFNVRSISRCIEEMIFKAQG